jgi:hypothetical protein
VAQVGGPHRPHGRRPAWEPERLDEENQRRIGLGSGGEQYVGDALPLPGTVAEQVSDLERRTGREGKRARLVKSKPSGTDDFYGEGQEYTEADRERDQDWYDKRGIVGNGNGKAPVQNALYVSDDCLPYPALPSR